MTARPLLVTIIACVYIAAGAIGFAWHFSEFFGPSSRLDIVGIEFIRVLAVVSGAFMLRGSNWARWLALAWIAFHVVLSAFHSAGQFAMHLLFFGVIAYCLLRPDATRYFSRTRTGAGN